MIRVSATFPAHLQERVVVRPLTPSDGRLVAKGFELLSLDSRKLRWGLPIKEPAQRLDWVARLGGSEHFAIGAGQRANGFPIGAARYVKTDLCSAEIALVVVDSWQGQGVGTLLLAQLLQHASVSGITLLRATVFVENTRARRMLRRVSGYASSSAQGVIDFEVRLPREDVS